MKNNELKDFWNNNHRIKKAEKELNQNIININKIKEFKTIKIAKKEDKKYKPTIFIIQILLNTVLFILSLFLSDIFLIIIFINFILFWLYALISIIKNDFKKKENKIIWILLIIFIPISIYLYPDFKEVQLEEEEKGFFL